jgi:hypothetical protein
MTPGKRTLGTGPLATTWDPAVGSGPNNQFTVGEGFGYSEDQWGGLGSSTPPPAPESPPLYTDYVSPTILDETYNDPTNADKFLEMIWPGMGGTPEGAENIKDLIPLLLDSGMSVDDVKGMLSGLDPRGGAAYTNYGDVNTSLQGPTSWETSLEGMIPGALEPGIHQDYAAGAAGQYGGRAGSNLSTDAYARLQGQMPNLQGGPGLDPYFENANRQAQERIRAQTAALGAYGGSTAAAMGAEATTNLAAEQAKLEADYRLRQLQEQRQWEALAGEMAGQGDTQSRGWLTDVGALTESAEGFDIDRGRLAADIAGKGGDLELDRYDTKTNAAIAAGEEEYKRTALKVESALEAAGMDTDKVQAAIDAWAGVDQATLNNNIGYLAALTGVDEADLRREFGIIDHTIAIDYLRQGNTQQAFENIFGTGSALATQAQDTYETMNSTDQALLMDILGAGTGAVQAALSSKQYQDKQLSESMMNILGLVAVL